VGGSGDNCKNILLEIGGGLPPYPPAPLSMLLASFVYFVASIFGALFLPCRENNPQPAYLTRVKSWELERDPLAIFGRLFPCLSNEQLFCDLFFFVV